MTHFELGTWIQLRFNKIIILGIFSVSLIFHSTIYFTIFSKNAEFSKYHTIATQYLHDEVCNERLLDFSPLYLYVHAASQKFFKNPDTIILWTQFILIAATCALFFILLRFFYGLSISLAGTAALLLSRSIILYAGVYEPEAFLVFFLIGFLTCTVRTSYLMTLFSGVFLGLCLLVRLNFFPLVAVAPLYFWFVRGKEIKVFRRITIFIIPVIIAVMVLMIRNQTITGSFNPMVMNPGYVFFEGNNPNANGQNAVYPPMVDNSIDEFLNEPDPAHAIYRFIPRRLAGKQLSIAAVNSYWAQKARNFISDHPIYWFRQVCNKLIFVFHNARWHDIAPVISNDLNLQKSRIPAVPFGLISAMALIGIILSFKAWKRQFIFYAVIICQIGVMALTYSSDRQRVSIIALFIFFALATLAAILSKSYSLRNKAIIVLGIIVLFSFFWIKNDLITDCLYQRSQFDSAQISMYEASHARETGNLKTASDKNAFAYAHIPYLIESRLSGLRFGGKTYEQQALSVAESLYSDKNNPSKQFDLATLYLENDKLNQSESIIQNLIRAKKRFSRNTTQSSQPYFYQASIDEKRGSRASAIVCFKKALEKNPGDPWVLSHLSVLTGDSLYKKQLSRYFDEIDCGYFMGLAFLSNKQFEPAVENLSYVVEKMPEYRDGFIYLAIALGGEKDFARAAQSYIKAMQKKRDPIFKEQEVLNIFNGWVENDPQNAEARMLLAMSLQDFGHYTEALKILNDLGNKNPALKNNPNIKWLVAALKKYD
jgi:tetratricopeptide (TPR) repeat protein